jgi:hypothetical protein
MSTGLDVLLAGNPSRYAAELRGFRAAQNAESGAVGYGGTLHGVRLRDFRRLFGQAFLDHAGTALYSEDQIRAATEELASKLFSNPHRCESQPRLPKAGPRVWLVLLVSHTWRTWRAVRFARAVPWLTAPTQLLRHWRVCGRRRCHC